MSMMHTLLAATLPLAVGAAPDHLVHPDRKSDAGAARVLAR